MIAIATSKVFMLGVPRVSYINEWFITEVLLLASLDITLAMVFLSPRICKISCDLNFAKISLLGSHTTATMDLRSAFPF